MTDPTTEQSLAGIEINNRLFFRLFQAANTLHTKGTQALDEFGITTQQWSVLGALSRPQAAAGMTVNELSHYLLVSRQNLTGLLSRLERDGLRLALRAGLRAGLRRPHRGRRRLLRRRPQGFFV